MKCKYTFLAMLLMTVVTGSACTFLYEENVSLRNQLSYSISEDSTPHIGIVIALPSEAFALTCYRLGLPFLKIAVISNNELTGSRFTPATIQTSMTNGAIPLQEMIMISN